MNFDNQLFYKIEDYLKGKLPIEEVTAFEKEIAADPSLAEMVDMHRFEKEGMEYLVEQDLRQKIKDWETNPTIKRRINLKIIISVAAGILILVFAVWFFFFKTPEKREIVNEDPPTEKESIDQNETPKKEEEEKPKLRKDIAETGKEKNELSTPKTDQIERSQNKLLALAENNYVLPDNLSSGLRSGNSENPENILSAGLKAFADDQMEKAILEFNKIDKEKNPAEYELAQEYLAHAYFKSRQFDKSAQLFKAIADDSSFNKGEPEWYLLLSLIGDYANKKVEADALLKKISSDTLHSHQQDAIQLKAKLDAIKN